MNTDAYYVPFTLRDVGLLRLPSEISHYRQFTPSPWQLFAYSYITPWIPSVLKQHLRRLIRNPDDEGFLTPLCINGISPPDLLSPPRLTTRSSRQIYSSVNDGLNAAYRATFDTYAAYTGIEWRYPFYDRRIIEFMLSLPSRLSFRKGYSRCILRQAMTGLLPEPIKMRRTKAHGGDLLDRGINEKENERVRMFINNSRSVSLGLVDPEKLSHAWDMYRGPRKFPVRPLVRYLCAEAWLRCNETRLGDSGNS
jgi:asparagine synthase (glutamine-hydrolysing)